MRTLPWWELLKEKNVRKKNSHRHNLEESLSLMKARNLILHAYTPFIFIHLLILILILTLERAYHKSIFHFILDSFLYSSSSYLLTYYFFFHFVHPLCSHQVNRQMNLMTVQLKPTEQKSLLMLNFFFMLFYDDPGIIPQWRTQSIVYGLLCISRIRPLF